MNRASPCEQALGAAATTFLLPLLLWSCGDVPTLSPGPCPRLSSVSVEPSSVTLAPGETAGLTVHLATRDGPVERPEVQWTSGDTAVAVVERTGARTAEVTGRSEGRAAVTATVSVPEAAEDCDAASLAASAAVEVGAGDDP